jgi:hypothetical protein
MTYSSRRRRDFAPAPLTTFALGVCAWARSGVPADVAHGEALARRWCASCHIVATRGADNAPAFASIAKMPGFSAEKITQFSLGPFENTIRPSATSLVCLKDVQFASDQCSASPDGDISAVIQRRER